MIFISSDTKCVQWSTNASILMETTNVAAEQTGARLQSYIMVPVLIDVLQCKPFLQCKWHVQKHYSGGIPSHCRTQGQTFRRASPYLEVVTCLGALWGSESTCNGFPSLQNASGGRPSINMLTRSVVDCCGVPPQGEWMVVWQYSQA